MTDCYDLWNRETRKRVVFDAPMSVIIEKVSALPRDTVLQCGIMWWPDGVAVGQRYVGQEILDLVDATRVCGIE